MGFTVSRAKRISPALYQNNALFNKHYMGRERKSNTKNMYQVYGRYVYNQTHPANTSTTVACETNPASATSAVVANRAHPSSVARLLRNRFIVMGRESRQRRRRGGEGGGGGWKLWKGVAMKNMKFSRARSSCRHGDRAALLVEFAQNNIFVRRNDQNTSKRCSKLESKRWVSVQIIIFEIFAVFSVSLFFT